MGASTYARCQDRNPVRRKLSLMQKDSSPSRRLSAREREVAEFVAAGKSNRAISQTLFLSERTVEHHVSSILNKLNLHSRVDLIMEMATPAQQSIPVTAGKAKAVPRMVFGIGARLRRAAWFAGANRARRDRLHDVLPRPATETLGRAEDVARVVNQFAASRLVTIAGAGGSGKSRVAIEAGFTVRGSQDITCIFVDLGECLTYEDVISALAAVCVRKRVESGDLVSAIIAALGEHELLLILDNCERVVASVAAFVRSLIAETPSVKVLITSRRPIGLAGERIVRINALLPAAAVRLFAARAQDVSGFTLDDSTLPPAAQLCAALDGLPLPLELAAAKTCVLSVQQLLDHQRDWFHLLTVETPAPPRQQSLHTLVDWSYQLLEPREQQLFRALSTFRSDWTTDDVQVLLNAMPAISVLEGLISLADQSLIFRSDRNGQPHFHMLETFRSFAEMRAAECGELTEPQR
jgi:predicted ATPase/DNA-binding CsgD family transcriptional regulator